VICCHGYQIHKKRERNISGFSRSAQGSSKGLHGPIFHTPACHDSGLFGLDLRPGPTEPAQQSWLLRDLAVGRKFGFLKLGVNSWVDVFTVRAVAHAGFQACGPSAARAGNMNEKLTDNQSLKES